jgi:hypothetical protein
VSGWKLLDPDNGHFESSSSATETNFAVWSDLLPVQLGEDQQRAQGVS